MRKDGEGWKTTALRIETAMMLEKYKTPLHNTYEKVINKMFNEFELRLFPRFVEVVIEEGKGEVDILPADDWHCPMMAEEPDLIYEGMPSYRCRFLSETNNPVKTHDCPHYIDMFSFDRWPWNPKEEREIKFYVKCGWPNKNTTLAR